MDDQAEHSPGVLPWAGAAESPASEAYAGPGLPRPHLLDRLDVPEVRYIETHTDAGAHLPECVGSGSQRVPFSQGDSHTAGSPCTTSAAEPSLAQDESRLLSLPPELIDTILAFLPPTDLAMASATCQALRTHANSELYWSRCVGENVPGVHLSSPSPFKTFRELYVAHNLHWFLPKYKIWFCDRDLVGKLIVVRYDPRRACIEGYELLAIKRTVSFAVWGANPNIVIHGFEPEVKLHLDKPVIQFKASDYATLHPSPNCRASPAREFRSEMPMHLDENMDTMFCNFMLARPLTPADVEAKTREEFPYATLWPPPAIPARHRVAGVATHHATGDLLPADMPATRSEASDQTFRIRRWIEMPGTHTAPAAMFRQGLAGMLQILTGVPPAAMPELGGDEGEAAEGVPWWFPSVHLGEEVMTYSTLDPDLYTPTELKPWRGIWVGDYSTHGCEFILIHQPDDGIENMSDEELGLSRRGSESDEMWEQRRRDARIYHGRLEAVKLTGDPNVPRGEYTFVADDLGRDGFIGVAQEHPFQGARIVKAKGHIARTGFHGNKFVESRLLLLSHNRLAQYWLGFGHISFFERVDIDQYIRM